MLAGLAMAVAGVSFSDRRSSRSGAGRPGCGESCGPADRASDASILYERMLEILARRGFEKPGWFTPAEFARHLPAEENRRVAEFTEVYNSIRFGGDLSATTRLAGLLQEFEAR